MQPKLGINMRGHVGNEADENSLPTASTCFNLLKLPPFTSEDKMRDKLLLAIEAGSGFELS
jgi:ubiquitin-protein ligase E3 C